MVLEEKEPNTTAAIAAKEIKQKTNQAYQEDMKKIWREKPLNEKYPQKTDSGDDGDKDNTLITHY